MVVEKVENSTGGNKEKWARHASKHNTLKSPLLATSEAFHGPRRCNIRQGSSIRFAAANC